MKGPGLETKFFPELLEFWGVLAWVWLMLALQKNSSP